MFITWQSVAGVSDLGNRVCSTSCLVHLAFHHSALHLCSVLLEDHLVAPTSRQGRHQSASAAAAGRRSINCCRCLKPSIKGSEQDTEEHHQNDDRYHFLLHCLLAASPVHARGHVLQPKSVHVHDPVLRVGGDVSRQLLCQSFHLCYRHVPVPKRKVHCRAPSTGA